MAQILNAIHDDTLGHQFEFNSLLLGHWADGTRFDGYWLVPYLILQLLRQTFSRLKYHAAES